jgi:hypothetical protein
LRNTKSFLKLFSKPGVLFAYSAHCFPETSWPANAQYNFFIICDAEVFKSLVNFFFLRIRIIYQCIFLCLEIIHCLSMCCVIIIENAKWNVQSSSPNSTIRQLFYYNHNFVSFIHYEHVSACQINWASKYDRGILHRHNRRPVGHSKTSVNFYWTTRCHILNDIFTKSLYKICFTLRKL